MIDDRNSCRRFTKGGCKNGSEIFSGCLAKIDIGYYKNFRF